MTKPSADLPAMMVELAFASWETVWHRTALIASGACTTAEYGSMMQEKICAVQQSGMALATGLGAAAVVRPFHAKAVANARRLRG